MSWYPTVFPDKCDGCEGFEKPRCIEFCPNGVFELREGKAIVANPHNCVHGCVACESVCPKKAITFPQRITVSGKTKKDKGCYIKLNAEDAAKSSGRTATQNYASIVKKKKRYNAIHHLDFKSVDHEMSVQQNISCQGFLGIFNLNYSFSSGSF